MSTVAIPSSLRVHCEHHEFIEVEGGSVHAVLAAVDARFPGFRAALGDSFAVAIDGEVFQDALYEPVAPESEVHFLPALAGGI